MRPRSVRAQVTASVAPLVMLLIALAGLTITLRIDHRDREDVDRQLVERADRVEEDAGKLIEDSQHPGPAGPAGPADEYGGLLAGSQSLVRLIANGQVVAARGEQPAAPLPLPDSDGLSTIDVGGEPWRSYVRPVAGAPDERLQVLQSLAPVEQRTSDNRRIVAFVALLATVATAAGVWFVTGLVLAPLRRLRTGAMRVRPGQPDRLPVAAGPLEVADLAVTLNGMLERLQTSMQATRRFTADAGHELRTPLTSLGMDLETLRRNPGLAPELRGQTLDAMAVEHHRMVALLEGLQALARGDAGALPERAPVDLGEVVAGAVERARARYPGVRFGLSAPGEAPVPGWRAGLLLAVTNLLDNAARHGLPDGSVEVGVVLDGPVARVVVDDGGPGIPPADRDAMRQRFTRGARPRSEGSGLGLALVEQQAALHGGRLELDASPAGGLRAAIVLPGVGP